MKRKPRHPLSESLTLVIGSCQKEVWYENLAYDLGLDPKLASPRRMAEAILTYNENTP